MNQFSNINNKPPEITIENKSNPSYFTAQKRGLDPEISHSETIHEIRENNDILKLDQIQETNKSTNPTQKKKKLKTSKANETSTNQNHNQKPKQSNLNINEIIEQIQAQKQDDAKTTIPNGSCQSTTVINTTDFELRLDAAGESVGNTSPTKVKAKPGRKNSKADENGLDSSSKVNRRRRSSTQSKNPTEPVNLQTIEDHSSCSTSSQQDEEIKELLGRNNQEQTNKDHNTSSPFKTPNSAFNSKVITDELKKLIQVRFRLAQLESTFNVP